MRCKLQDLIAENVRENNIFHFFLRDPSEVQHLTPYYLMTLDLKAISC